MSSSATKNVTVVIPLYRLDFSPMEAMSLRRCFEVMRRREIAIVHPRSLDIAPLASLAGSLPLRSEAFDDGCFSGREAYNRLLLSAQFYERFLDSEFIVVVQSDVYLFADRLDEWLERDCDYVGAPWLPAAGEVSGWNVAARAVYALRRLVARMSPRFSAVSLKWKVGNGGFSLRRTRVMHNLVSRHAGDIGRILDAGHRSERFEDVVLSVTLAGRYPGQIRVATWREALDFAVESHPAHAMRLSGGKLPMGTHAFYRRRNRQEWRPWVDFDALVADSQLNQDTQS